MSQTATAPTVPAAVTAPAAPPSGALSVPQPTSVSRTPQQLRQLGTAVLGLGIAFGVAGLVAFVLLGLALSRAGDSTAQLIRVQQIQTSLLAADASATNAFLVGGLEPAAQRQAYDQAIGVASTTIAEAARAEPADEQALSQLNQQLVAYAATIEQARANNRQGFQVGAQYLRTASSTLRSDALPILDNLVAADSARAASGMDTDEAWLFTVVGFLSLAGFVLAQVWLGRRFRRTFNPLLVVATGVALLAWVGLLIAIGNVSSSVRAVRDESFADVNAAATARIRAFDAKSNESLTLIARGSGSSFEKAWQSSAAQVTGTLVSLPPGARTAWQSYTKLHTEIRTLDDGGDWDAAVKLATASGNGSANAAFAAFDEQSSSVVEGSSATATGVLRGHLTGMIVAAVVALLAGLAAAVLGRRGIETRLREYR